MIEQQISVASTLGPIFVTASNEGITGISFNEPLDAVLAKPASIDTPILSIHQELKKAKVQISEYLVGERKVFDLKLAPKGTDFQKKVWKTLGTIPFGQTWSYKKLAEAIDKPQAVRAVGQANGKNPLWLVIPCHRVIAHNGALGGYAGGTHRKKWLLELESNNL